MTVSNYRQRAMTKPEPPPAPSMKWRRAARAAQTRPDLSQFTAPALRCSAAHRPKADRDEPSEHAQIEWSGQEARASEDPGRCGSESEHSGEHAPIAEPCRCAQVAQEPHPCHKR